MGLMGFHLGSGFLVKTVVSTIASVLGLIYLALGKKEGDGGKMIVGAVLLAVSFFIF